MAERLAPLGNVTVRNMFGGCGIFLDSTMFALIDRSGGVFLRADERTSARFEEAGSARHGKMPYWQAPDEVVDDRETLLGWARQALAAAQGAKR